MSKFRAIFIGGCVLFIAWFIAFGGETIGPWLDDLGESIRLHRFLYECEPNAMCLNFYYRSLPGQYITAKVDFTSKKITVEGGGYRIRRGLFWQNRLEAVFSNLTFPLADPPSQLTDVQISEIKMLLSAMPAASQPIRDSDFSHNGCQLAFYRGNDLQVEHFRPGNAPTQIGEICRIIGFSPIFDNWNIQREVEQ